MKQKLFILPTLLIFCSNNSQAQWLPLTGGTITGSLTVNGAFTGTDAFLDKGFFNSVNLGGLPDNQKLMIYNDGTDISGFGQSTAEFRMYAPLTNHTSFGNYDAATNTFHEKMRLTANGRLGIGAINPSAVLSLGPITGHHKLLIYDDGAAEGSGFGQGESEFRMFAPSTGTNHISFGNYDLQSGAFAEHMRIAINGNIGIGTPFPNEKLCVNGTIRSRRVKVEQDNWPDFVFNPDYQLMPINQVEDFITKNKHLPGIPSAVTVQLQGVDLGDNQAAFLQKIEELTLYLIDANKSIQELKNQLTALDKENKSLKEQADLLNKLEERIKKLEVRNE